MVSVKLTVEDIDNEPTDYVLKLGSTQYRGKQALRIWIEEKP